MNKKFYISTPIYYPNEQLHIGHVYSTLIADFFSRWKKNNNFDVFFITGSDEHGKKIEKSARDKNLQPKEYVDRIVETFVDLWDKYEIKYDKFIRTSDEFHKNVCQKVFSFLLEKNFIYKGTYEGYYCISCEAYFSQSEVKNNNVCPLCFKPLSKENEETYYLKISQFSFWVEKLLKENKFLIPDFRVKELLNNFIAKNLSDLSITRLNIKWGIQTKNFPNHTLYVWIDALMNYLTGLGFNFENSDQKYFDFWNDPNTEKIHIVGKEITRFHCIYWPILLKMLNIALPSKVIAHGWIINEGVKMSKSIGNVINPTDLLQKYPLDTIRYYLLSNSNFENDFMFSFTEMISKYNNDIINVYVNLVSRTLGMLEKYNENTIPAFEDEYLENDFYKFLNLENEFYLISQMLNNFETSLPIKKIITLLKNTNKYVEDLKPWDLFKNQEKKKINEMFFNVFNCIKYCHFLLSPILLHTNKIILKNMNIDKIELKDLKNLKFFDNHKINSSKTIIERIKIHE